MNSRDADDADRRETMAAASVLPKLVGQRFKRREDPRLIQGRGIYVDDVKIPGMQHLAFKRSDIAHGRVRSIDTSSAEAMHGVEAVFTGAQIAEFLAPMPIGTPSPSPEHRAVAVDTVRFVGDPVAVVVACDRYVARDAADAVVVDYEPLPAVVDPEKAMSGESVVLHAGFANNVALGPLPSGTGVSRKGAVGDTAVDAAFEAADVVIVQRMVNQRLAPSSIEARGVVAHYEPGREALTIWSSTQNPHILRTFLAQTLGLGEDRVRAIAPEVGGGFGAKINIYGEEYVVAALSRRLGLPIKWIEDRSEAFLATVHGRDLIAHVELAAAREGKVLGLRMRIIADIGAYSPTKWAATPSPEKRAHSFANISLHVRGITSSADRVAVVAIRLRRICRSRQQSHLTTIREHLLRCPDASNGQHELRHSRGCNHAVDGDDRWPGAPQGAAVDTVYRVLVPARLGPGQIRLGLGHVQQVVADQAAIAVPRDAYPTAIRRWVARDHIGREVQVRPTIRGA